MWIALLFCLTYFNISISSERSKVNLVTTSQPAQSNPLQAPGAAAPVPAVINPPLIPQIVAPIILQPDPAVVPPQDPAANAVPPVPLIPPALTPYLRQLPPDFALHVGNTLPEPMARCKRLIELEDQLGSARQKAFLISGLGNDGKISAIEVIAQQLQRPCIVVDSEELIRTHQQQSFNRIRELLNLARTINVRHFFVCKRLDLLDKAYKELWRNEFAQNPTLQLWEDMKTASTNTPENRLLPLCTTDCEYPLSISAGDAEKNISLSAVLEKKQLLDSDCFGIGHYTQQDKRGLQALCFYLRQDGYTLNINRNPHGHISDLLCIVSRLGRMRVGEIKPYFEKLKRIMLLRNPVQRCIDCNVIINLEQEETAYRRSRLSFWQVKKEQAKTAGEVTALVGALTVGLPIVGPFLIVDILCGTDEKRQEILEAEYRRLMPNDQNH